MIGRRSLAQEVFIYLSALVVAIAVLAPPAWLFISSISSQSELLNIPVHWIPQEPSFERYRQIAFATGTDSAAVFRRSMLNSLIIASSVTAICVVIGSVAAYSFARMRFAGDLPAMATCYICCSSPIPCRQLCWWCLCTVSWANWAGRIPCMG
jgi:multiple sugar transport system permease protein